MSDGRWPTGDPFWFDIVAGADATYTFSAMLASFDPGAPALDVDWSDISASEVTDGSYAPVLLTGGIVDLDLVSGYTTFRADDVDFGSPVGGESVGKLVLWADTGGGDGPLMGWWDWPALFNGVPQVAPFSADGMARIENV